MELFSERDEGCIGPSGTLLCFWQTLKSMQHMHGNIPYMFDCQAHLVVHLLLLKSSMWEQFLWSIMFGRHCSLSKMLIRLGRMSGPWLFCSQGVIIHLKVIACQAANAAAAAASPPKIS